MRVAAVVLALVVLSLGCSAAPAPGFDSVDGGGASDRPPPAMDVTSAGPDVRGFDIPPLDVAHLDAAPRIDNVRVYAHTAVALFVVDPLLLSVTPVGAFGWPADGQDHQMTDIAVTADEHLWGVTFNALYQIDRATAQCTFVASLSGSLIGLNFNGLTFVPAGVLGSQEVLVASTQAGAYYLVDTRTGNANRLGSYGDGIGSSGDLVAVAGAGMYATVTRGGAEYLARIDPRTGVATVVGPTGVSGTWGLGYWRARIYGFTNTGSFVTIDIATGRATVVSTSSQSWWGAGVTTIAPTAPP